MNPFVAAVALCAPCAASLAIVVADESQYIDRPARAVVGKLRGGTCVPIGDRYALTANHVGVQAGHTIEVDGASYTVSRIHRHPGAPAVDLKILEIGGPPFFPRWTPIHPDPQSVPRRAPLYLGGYGVTTAAIDGDCALWGQRLERWAMNTLEGHAGQSAWYRFDLDVPNEGMAAVYDSGAPMLVADERACAMWVVGVATSATSGSVGPSCDGHTAYYTEVDPLWLLPFTGPSCEGDLDADGDADVSDFAILAANFGTTDNECVTYSAGDLNGNGLLDLDDVAIMMVSFGCRD